MEQRDREKIVEGFVKTGLPRDRARLVVDVGVKAAEEAVKTLVDKCSLVGDQTGNIAAQSVALQLVEQEASFRLKILVAVSMSHGLPTQAVQLGGEE